MAGRLPKCSIQPATIIEFMHCAAWQDVVLVLAVFVLIASLVIKCGDD